VAEGETALMTRSGPLVAVIEGAICTLPFDAVDGVLDVDKRTLYVKSGTKLTELPVPKRPNCTFKGWYTSEGVPVTNGTTWVASGTTSIAAKWLGDVQHSIAFDARRTIQPDIFQQPFKAAYGEPMQAVFPPDRTDRAAFLGWWLDGVQCYGSDGYPLEGFSECPWERDVTLTARWALARDAFANPFTPANGVTNVVIGVEATDEPDEPDHDGEGILRATHWYCFEVSNGVPVTVTFNDLSGVEGPCVAIAAYRGDDLGDLACLASTLDFKSFETTLEWPPTKTEVVRLALAQDGAPGEAGLSAYEITVTGSGFVSAWINPDKLPGETAEERNALALTLDGFSEAVSQRVAPVPTYASFTKWAHVGDPAAEVPPDRLAAMPNVVLASAYDLTVVPTGMLSVVAYEVTKTDADKTAMRLTLRVSGTFTDGGAKDKNLLVAAIGVKGSPTVGGIYSVDNFDYLIEADDVKTNDVHLLVTPKKAKEDDPPLDAFFVIPVAY